MVKGVKVINDTIHTSHDDISQFVCRSFHIINHFLIGINITNKDGVTLEHANSVMYLGVTIENNAIV